MAGKTSALAELTLAELVAELRESKQEALNLRFRNATGQLDNTAEIRGCVARSPASTRSSVNVRSQKQRQAHERNRTDTRGGGWERERESPRARSAKDSSSPTDGQDGRRRRHRALRQHLNSNKFVLQTKRLYAHDESNDVNVGDKVR